MAQIGKTLAFSAVGGMLAGLSGLTACGGGAPEVKAPDGAPSAEPAAAMPAAGAKDCCKGKNDCKAKGNCKVEGANDCKGKNECKGKGGCKAADCGGH